MGEPGENGQKGSKGESGKQGEKGQKGCIGEKGQRGDMGEEGQKGEKGRRGYTGRKGQEGDTGEKGQKGDIGLTGSPGGGVTYTYWGKSKCLINRTTVYNGYTSGGQFTIRDGYAGSSNLCVSNNSKHHEIQSIIYPSSNKIRIAGTQITVPKTYISHVPYRYQNIPCAVCHVSTRSSQIMIPGTYQCLSGWTAEYDGWLMGGRYNSTNTPFCMAKMPEEIPGVNGGTYIEHMYAGCTRGIPCPPYDENKEMSCVVCTM